MAALPRTSGGHERDGYRCVDCGNGHDLTLDHILPLAVEGKASYSDTELVTSCRS